MTTTKSRHDTMPDIIHTTERDTPLDAIFDVLSSQRCRTLLGHLAESDEDRFSVTDLAAELADDDPEDRIRTRLHHTHLPKLTNVGLVEYDSDCKVVTYLPNAQFEAMIPTIEAFEDADQSLSLDVVFDLLADFRRRTALLTLLTYDTLSLPDLADEVAIAEYDEPLPEIDADTVLHVYLSLYHTHVPKLTDADLVEYDQASDFVRLTDTGRAFESTVRALCDPADG